MEDQTSREVRAMELFHEGYNCAQSVFAAFASDCQLPEAMALKLSAPFGAGFGRMREVCGAVCGAAMVAGAFEGNDTPNTDDKERIFTLVQQFAAQFKEEFGTYYCRELLGLEHKKCPESARPSDRTAAYYGSRPCEHCVAFASRMAAEYLRTLRAK